MPVTTPPVIPEPFAESGDRASIPDTTGVSGRASWSLGFPPITMEAKISGGIPPDGRDVNGVLWAISAHALYVQAGQPFQYNSTISTDISGYGLGAMLGSADGATLWYNLLDGNTVDPDGAGTNWVSAFTYGSIAISALVGGTRTLTRLESRFGLLILAGTLASNQTIILPNLIREWRIVNNTTGAFTTTVKTAAGAGVTVPQGGPSVSVGVYGNGTDIYLAVPPVSLPIAVTPTPDTLVLRDNVGDSFSRYFNSSSSPEVPAIQNVIVTNGSDGYYRKISITNFEQQLSLPAINGQVVNGQVPQSAVSQFFVTTITAAGKVLVLPDGTRIARGTAVLGNIPPSPTPGIVNISFVGLGFTAKPVMTIGVEDPNGGLGGVFSPVIQSLSASGATIYINELNSGVQNITFDWIAIGV